MKKSVLALLLAAVVSGGCTFLKVSLTPEPRPLVEQRIAGSGEAKVLVIDISGVISSARSGSRLGEGERPGLLARVREELDRARADRRVKALVLRINSPGGGVTASDTLHQELLRFKGETGVAVAAHIMDVGASGGYYAALAADAVYAQPTSITGSIGVMMVRVDARGLLEKIGVQAEQLVSGERKGMGSPLRALTAEERKFFQGIIDSLHARFLETVAKGRRLPADKVRALGDGRVFTSREALEAGLIDGIGYLDDAVVAVKRRANLAEATVVTYIRPGEYRSNIYSMSLIPQELSELAEPGTGFWYLWWP